MKWKLNAGAVALLLLSACGSARPAELSPTADDARQTLHRARSLHWLVQVYAADSVQAEGKPTRIGSASAVVGGDAVTYEVIDSIYRWSPDVTTESKAAAVTGAVIVGGLGALLGAALCGYGDEDAVSCIGWLGGGGATIGAFLGASVGGLLSPSEGTWVPLWRT